MTLVDVVVDGLTLAIVSDGLVADVRWGWHPRDLCDNELSGNIPESIGNLQNLGTL